MVGGGGAAVAPVADTRTLPRVLLVEKGIQSYTLETYFMGGRVVLTSDLVDLSAAASVTLTSR